MPRAVDPDPRATLQEQRRAKHAILRELAVKKSAGARGVFIPARRGFRGDVPEAAAPSGPATTGDVPRGPAVVTAATLVALAKSRGGGERLPRPRIVAPPAPARTSALRALADGPEARLRPEAVPWASHARASSPARRLDDTDSCASDGTETPTGAISAAEHAASSSSSDDGDHPRAADGSPPGAAFADSKKPGGLLDELLPNLRRNASRDEWDDEQGDLPPLPDAWDRGEGAERGAERVSMRSRAPPPPRPPPGYPPPGYPPPPPPSPPPPTSFAAAATASFPAARPAGASNVFQPPVDVRAAVQAATRTAVKSAMEAAAAERERLRETANGAFAAAAARARGTRRGERRRRRARGARASRPSRRVSDTSRRSFRVGCRRSGCRALRASSVADRRR